jgi:MATE family multidrug resistance protein
MLITAFSNFGACLHMAVKEYLQAFEIVFIPNLVTVICVFLNIALNIILVFGWGIIPSLGVVGLAIASLITRYVMGLTLYFYALFKMHPKDFHKTGFYQSLIKIGFPIAFAIMIEFVAFNIIVVFLGKVSGAYAAAQNLICTLTTVSFMVPLAISNAIAVKAGFANGADNMVDFKRYSFIGMAMCVGFMTVSAIIVTLFPEFLIGLFTKDLELIKICVPVVLLLGIFQIFDGLQVALAGIFKGLKDTKIVLIANFISYWLISIPLGYTLSFKFGLTLKGFWIGLISSAIVLCTIMFSYFIKKLKQHNANI